MFRSSFLEILMIKSHINSQRGELDMTDCISFRTVALREEKNVERVPPIVKTVHMYLLRKKS